MQILSSPSFAFFLDKQTSNSIYLLVSSTTMYFSSACVSESALVSGLASKHCWTNFLLQRLLFVVVSLRSFSIAIDCFEFNALWVSFLLCFIVEFLLMSNAFECLTLKHHGRVLCAFWASDFARTSASALLLFWRQW